MYDLEDLTAAYDRLADRFPTELEIEITSDERYVLVERDGDCTYALTPNATIEGALGVGASDEEAGRWWEPVCVVDLVTGDEQRVIARVEYVLDPDVLPE